MEYISNIIMNFVDNLNFVNMSIFLINGVILILGKHIVNILDTSELKKKPDEDQKGKKLKTLKFINALLAITYLISLFINKDIFQDIILSLFTILVIYLINSWLIYQIILFYGKEIETKGDSYFQESPTSEIFSFVLHIISIIIGLIIVLNIFDLNSWMQAGGVIGGILAFLGFTANNWAPDIIAGLLLLHSKRISQGDVIKIQELDNRVAWVKTISLTEVKLIDLITENAIVIRTSKFREYVIENISIGIKNSGKKDFLQYIDLKIGYGEKYTNIEELCKDAFTKVKEDVMINNKLLSRAFTKNDVQLKDGEEEKVLENNEEENDNGVEVEIIDNGDHAVVYRFFYTIYSPKLMIKVKNRLNRELYKLSEERGIGLNTPFSINMNKN